MKCYIEEKSWSSKVKIALAQVDVIPNKSKKNLQKKVKNG
jgi:hypothetical protein